MNLINKNYVIGALHFSPTEGYENFTDYETILGKALADLKSFEEGGVDAIIVENNYNLPHAIKENEESIKMILQLTQEIIRVAKVPIGVSMLWNDYESAFLIAREAGAKFIRVPVFVDSVKTAFGEIIANSEDVINTRKSLGAENVLIYADIQVKHAEMLDKEKSLRESALEAKNQGADGVIITGKWTGDAPMTEHLKEVRVAVGDDYPIIIGSGANKENILELFETANAAIVSTSLKEGETKGKEEERNLKPFEAKISAQKVRDFMGMAEKNKNILFDVDGTFYKLNNGFRSSSIYREMRQRTIAFLSTTLKISEQKAEEEYERILKEYDQQLSIGFEKEFNISRTDYFNYAWDIDPRKHIEENENLQDIFKIISEKYSIYLVSDAPLVWIKRVNSFFGIERYIKRICSGESDTRKVFGNRFTELIKELNVLPTDCTMVGDNEKEDILKAKEIGMNTIYVGDKESVAEFTINNINKIGEILS